MTEYWQAWLKSMLSVIEAMTQEVNRLTKRVLDEVRVSLVRYPQWCRLPDP
jgi:hypothetical protein